MPPFQFENEILIHPLRAQLAGWDARAIDKAVRRPPGVRRAIDIHPATQIEAIERAVAGPVQKVILKHCGHSPHLDQPDQTLAMINGFVQKISSKK